MSKEVIVQEAMNQVVALTQQHRPDFDFPFQDQVTILESCVKLESDLNVHRECEEIFHTVENLSQINDTTNSIAIEIANLSEELKRAAFESTVRSRAARKRLILL